MIMESSPRQTLSAPVGSYVAGVTLLSVVVCVLLVAGTPLPAPPLLLFWTLAFLAGELMSFQTPTGKGTVSMAASVGHELNNYLAVLTGNLQLMPMIRDDYHVKDKERLQNVVEQVKRMSTLSKGLMDFSHLDSKPVPTDLRALLRDPLDFLGPQNRFDGVDVSLEIDPRIGVVSVDPAQIQQVVMNLAMNAADAMCEAESFRLQLRIWARWNAGRDIIELGVEDTGPGIPPELRRRIFDPGFTTRETGRGFGLSTVYRIVSNHGGKIAVEEGQHGGTMFRIQLPAIASGSRSLSAA